MLNKFTLTKMLACSRALNNPHSNALAFWSVAEHKTAVNPWLPHWSYHGLVLRHPIVLPSSPVVVVVRQGTPVCSVQPWAHYSVCCPGGPGTADRWGTSEGVLWTSQQRDSETTDPVSLAAPAAASPPRGWTATPQSATQRATYRQNSISMA